MNHTKKKDYNPSLVKFAHSLSQVKWGDYDTICVCVYLLQFATTQNEALTYADGFSNHM